MNILAVMAHPDDEILGCGATLARLRAEGHHVYTSILCSHADARADRPDDLKRFASEAAAMIGVEESANYEFANIRFNTVPHIEMVKAIEKAILRFRPEWVFTHHPSDLNIDHRVCYEATVAAVMLPQRLTTDVPPTLIKKVFLCEVLSSTDWAPSSGPAFQPNAFVNVAETFPQKLEALAHFAGAMKPFPHSRSLENVRHLAHLRGAQAGLELAEAFHVIRDVMV
ncbi:MAG TPA: PIG-L family deacetylase [Thermoanaerobaculia bacterium]|nr:PIG-L family deacetylase [Thermoanaerobaculia bacterium]